MSVTTLTCSAKRKHYGLQCQALAVWAIKGTDGYWHGACHQHPHQVLKRLGAGGDKLEVRLATEAMAENARLLALPGVLTRAEELAEVLRPLVLEGDDERWTPHRVRYTLIRQAGDDCGDEVAGELLEVLCEERVLESQGEGVYVCIAALPR